MYLGESLSEIASEGGSFARPDEKNRSNANKETYLANKYPTFS